MSTLDVELQNGGTKVLLIESFRGLGIIARAGKPVKWSPDNPRTPGQTERFASLDEAQAFIKRKRLEVTTTYIKGSKALRDIQRGQVVE